MHTYFSDREAGARPRIESELTQGAWSGIVSYFDFLVEKAWFANDFPEQCRDKRGVVATKTASLWGAIHGEIPALNNPYPLSDPYPHTLTALDLIEFGVLHVAQPIETSYHDYYEHHHLEFDRAAGVKEYREKINLILARHGLIYELNEKGKVVRLGSEVLRDRISETELPSGDPLLDRLLGEARQNYFDPDPAIRKNGVEKLWDAFERLKTLEVDVKKDVSISRILEQTSKEPNFRAVLDAESTALTKIGNDFHIRHYETNRTPLEDSFHVDYLFHRLFSLIELILWKRLKVT